MVVVSGVIEVAAASREQALAAAREMARATRTEPGCRTYAFFSDIENPNRVRVFEEWEDREALDRHFEAPHMATFRRALSKVEILAQEIQCYHVAKVEPLG